MWNTLANWWEYKVKDVLTLKGVGIKEYNGFYGLKSFASTVISKDEDNDKTINVNGPTTKFKWSPRSSSEQVNFNSEGKVLVVVDKQG
ncbi:hypothetical protein TKK_0012450 [Trichogramma kaykai]